MEKKPDGRINTGKQIPYACEKVFSESPVKMRTLKAVVCGRAYQKSVRERGKFFRNTDPSLFGRRCIR